MSDDRKLVTRAMVDAARRAEFDHYQRGGLLGSRFIPTPDAVIRLMLEAALNPQGPKPIAAVPAKPIGRIVTAQAPKRRKG